MTEYGHFHIFGQRVFVAQSFLNLTRGPKFLSAALALRQTERKDLRSKCQTWTSVHQQYTIVFQYQCNLYRRKQAEGNISFSLTQSRIARVNGEFFNNPWLILDKVQPQAVHDLFNARLMLSASVFYVFFFSRVNGLFALRRTQRLILHFILGPFILAKISCHLINWRLN